LSVSGPRPISLRRKYFTRAIHLIRVTQEGEYRYLSFDRTRGSQSVLNINNHDELNFAYTRAMFVSLAFLDRLPEKVLFVGLGGGMMPRVFAKYLPQSVIDIAEIDPDVVRVAREFFFFTPSPRLQVAAEDGRLFLRRHQELYDLIFLDAYNDQSIPFHLTTKEFFEIVKQRLKPHGVVASNVWSPGSNQYHFAQMKTLQMVFPRLYEVRAVGSGNHIFISTMEKKDITLADLERRVETVLRQVKFPFDLDEFVRTFEDITQKEVDAEILTDDFAPVDLLRAERADGK
jgi:spermidine synthase